MAKCILTIEDSEESEGNIKVSLQFEQPVGLESLGKKEKMTPSQHLALQLMEKTHELVKGL